MHAVAPKQRIRILTIQIAVADEADPDSVADEISELLTAVSSALTENVDPDSVADEISELLSEYGICSDSSHILDWRYLTEYQPLVTASDAPEEGEVFGLLDFNLTITNEE